MNRPNFGLNINYHGKHMTIKPSELHFTRPDKTNLVFFIDKKTGCIVEFLISDNKVCDPSNRDTQYGTTRVNK